MNRRGRLRPVAHQGMDVAGAEVTRGPPRWPRRRGRRPSRRAPLKPPAGQAAAAGPLNVAAGRWYYAWQTRALQVAGVTRWWLSPSSELEPLKPLALLGL